MGEWGKVSSYVLNEKFKSDVPKINCLPDEVNQAYEIILLKSSLSFSGRFILQVMTKTVIVPSRIKDPIYQNMSYFTSCILDVIFIINVTQSTQSKFIRSTTNSVTLRVEGFKRTAGTADFSKRHRWTWRSRGKNRNT